MSSTACGPRVAITIGFTPAGKRSGTLPVARFAWQALCTDITQRKEAEADSRGNAAEIQRANETLRIAEAEARKAVVERDQFLAMLSHELRNPLSAILSGVGVLDHADADRDSVDRARQAIRRQVSHMSRLLDDLLDVARITQGKIGFRKRVARFQ